MGRFLTDEQLERIKRELTTLYALPYATDLFGTAWEQILAAAKGGEWTGKRDNRANPDIYARVGGKNINYSVKCEALKVTSERMTAADFLGRSMDFIVARPKVDELLGQGQTIGTLDATALGNLVLQYYNERIVKAYHWEVLSFLAPVLVAGEAVEFVYWEESPPTVYDPNAYWWEDTGRATGSNRNIAAYPNAVPKEAKPRPASKFRWTSGGKQFYVLYDIPADADTWRVEKVRLSREELWTSIERKLREKKRAATNKLAT